MRRCISLVWGIDPIARSFATKFLNFLERKAIRSSESSMFEPGPNPARELRKKLAEMRELNNGGGTGSEPEVVFFAAAFAPQEQSISNILHSTSAVLETALPGSRSMILIVLLPPAIAADEEKIRTWEFFLELESLPGSIPFLNIVFVNQLSSAMYLNATADDILYEILDRELQDEDLQTTIRSKGFAEARNPQKIGHRNCSYSTIGTLRLVYSQSEALEYLRARFGKSIFEDGLANRAAVPDAEMQLIHEQISGFFKAQSRFWPEHLPKTGIVSASVFSQPLDPSGKAKAILGLEQEFEQALRTDDPQFEQNLNSQAAQIREAFGQYTKGGVKLIAGGAVFMDTLLGDTSGIGFFEETFCRNQLAKQVDEALNPLFIRALARSAVDLPPERKQDESGCDWLVRAVAFVRPAAQASVPGAASPLRFLCAAFDRLCKEVSAKPYDADSTREILREVAAEFAEESIRLFDPAEKLRKEHDSLSEELRLLPAKLSFIGRLTTKRSELHASQARLRGEIEKNEECRRDLERSHESMKQILLSIVNRIILPHLQRVRIKGGLGRRGEEVVTEFRSFVESVGSQLNNLWNSTPSGIGIRGPAEESALTERRRELLYRIMTGSKAMIHHAQAAMVFTGPSRDATIEPTYHKCRTLQDHCEAGATSLLDRVEDYISSLLQPIKLMDILEVIELEGKDVAKQYFADRALWSARSLEFASGFIPAVAGVLHTTFTVKIAGGPESRLASEYESAFQPDRNFAHLNDPFQIEIVSQRFGFPAFLIQGLHEARMLAQTANAAGARDLWPESGAQTGQAN
jgi:hypothetical protein